MIKSDYTWQTFGAELIATEDLDPVYVFLADANVDDDTLLRWLLAYWCYYHSGVASYIAEAGSDRFYDRMWDGLEYGWPRGMERRYFYGKSAANAINHLEQWPPEEIVLRIAAHRTFKTAAVEVQKLVGFGPWMGWKAVDMIERVLAEPVDFSDSTLGIYKDPIQGAALVKFGDWKHPITTEEVNDVVEMMLSEFGSTLAPPYYDRVINIQEVETILCKGKSSFRHHYPMGNDAVHMKEHLTPEWGDLAMELRRWLPPVKPEWLDAELKYRRFRVDLLDGGPSVYGG